MRIGEAGAEAIEAVVVAGAVIGAAASGAGGYQFGGGDRY